MRISVKFQPESTDWASLRKVWEVADSLPEIDAAYLFDHFYPIGEARQGRACFEGWSALAFLAGVSERLRLGLVVSGVTYRHPAVLANMCATLDVASRGRLEIGLGAAWNEEEHRAYGIAFPTVGTRMDMLQEACEVVDSLLTSEVSDLDGEHYTLRDAYCEPKPVQRPRPPFVIGGQGERRLLPIAARWADQWNYPGRTGDGLRAKLDVLRVCCADIGRDPDTIEVSSHVFDPTDPGLAVVQARELTDAGCQNVILYFQPPFSPGLVASVARAVADAVL